MATLDQCMTMLDRFIEKYGGSIHDFELGKTWDPGQAICRELYGPHWSHSAAWKEADAIEEGVVDEFVETGRDMIEKTPAWMSGDESA
ncbi:hypothetical protein LCGC14_2725440 [marine sediment metagenome]|uniref:Uncharacterized protein n=1 Tax=marine sediment metagenome TaxID=412755 RepID=A0A0F8ZWB2_9ZZZZ